MDTQMSNDEAIARMEANQAEVRTFLESIRAQLPYLEGVIGYPVIKGLLDTAILLLDESRDLIGAIKKYEARDQRLIEILTHDIYADNSKVFRARLLLQGVAGMLGDQHADQTRKQEAVPEELGGNPGQEA